MDVILQSYYILLPIVATSLLGWVGWLLQNQNKKEKIRDEEAKKKEQREEAVQTAITEGIMLVLRYMLKRYHSEYMIQEKITYDQYKDWGDLFNAYVTLGGNSIAELWNEDIENLPKCDSVGETSPFEALLKRGMDEISKPE